MPPHSSIRDSLRAFLGDERYGKFVEQGVKVEDGELRNWWQQDAWERFVAAHPEFAVGFAELEAALRVCPRHGDNLRPDTVPVFGGHRYYRDDFMAMRHRLFPRAADLPFSTKGTPFEGDRYPVWFCPTCREAVAAWYYQERANGRRTPE